MHSVRIELAKLILVGTRITYRATGDAGYVFIQCCQVAVHIIPLCGTRKPIFNYSIASRGVTDLYPS